LNQLAREGADEQSIQAAKQAMELKQDIYATTLEEYEQSRLREALRSKSISIVEPATAPSSPSKPNKILNIGLSLMVGLAAGLGLAFLFENLDSTIYSVDQIEDLTRLPNLGSVPDAIIRKRFISTNGSNPYTEAFRRIRTIIWSRETDQPINALMITSPEPGEGKSTIVSDLAFVLAQSGHKVVVVDGDMRLPNQHKLFNLPNDRGLSNVLAQEINLEEALQLTEVPGLRVLTSGPIPGNPSELLGTYQMNEIMDQLREKFNIVLVDTPALLQVTDAIVLAPQVDGVVLVVCRANSRRQDVVSAIKQLEEINANMIGFIANRSGQNVGYYYYHRPRRSYFKKIF
jgi:polysaccharide biosynthesis transport protein